MAIRWYVVQWGVDNSKQYEEHVTQTYTFPLAFSQVFIAAGLGYSKVLLAVIIKVAELIRGQQLLLQ